MSKPDQDKKPASGHVRHEPGGRAIWEWAVESGRHAVDSTSRLLKKLELSSMTLMGDDARPWQKQVPVTAEVPLPVAPAEIRAEVDPAAGKGFNPYDNRAPVRATATPSRRRTPQEQPAPKRGFFARLFSRS